MKPSRNGFARWIAASSSCAAAAIAIRFWHADSFVPGLLWSVAVALGIFTAWKAMLSGAERQDWLSGGLFVYHVLSLPFLLLEVLILSPDAKLT
jgi:hypothetical protein